MQAGEAPHDSTILIEDVINIELLIIYPNRFCLDRIAGRF